MLPKAIVPQVEARGQLRYHRDMLFDTPEKVTPNMRALPQMVEGVLRNYDPAAQEAARALIPLYGVPAEANAFMLIWNGPAPFYRTILSAEATPHNFPTPHKDMLEQCVKYPVGDAIGKFDDLGAFDGSVTAKRTEGLLCARHDNPAMNFLALNLAHDIITSKRTWQDARAYYAKAAALYKAGKTPKYAAGLIFTPKPGADPDVAVRG